MFAEVHLELSKNSGLLTTTANWDRKLRELGPQIARIGTANYANCDRELRELGPRIARIVTTNCANWDRQLRELRELRPRITRILNAYYAKDRFAELAKIRVH